MKIVIVYDIAENSLRYKVSEYLKNFGLQRIGFSVFGGEIKKEHFQELKKFLESQISQDRLHIFLLCNKCFNRISFLGTAEFVEYPKNTVL